jgi:hypothetical protein
MKEQLIECSEQLSDKDEELGKYQYLGLKINLKEEKINKILLEKELREEELLTKLSLVADHFK